LPLALNAMLQEQFPNAEFEVLNRGVLAYSSYQGVQLLRDNIHELDPDVVIIAYAMNDAKVAGYRDKDRAAQEKNLPLTEKITRLMRNSETYKLLQFTAQILMHKSLPIGFNLKNAAEGVKNDVTDFDKLEPWTRVGLRDYRNNITDMIRLARSRDAYPILLYNELWEDGLYLRVLREISEVEQVPLIDGSAIIRRERQRIARQLESGLGLQVSAIHNADENKDKHVGEAESNEVDVVFRLYAGEYAVPRAMYIVGPEDTLGGLIPNKVAMHDDGTHGDERAGDSVWSYTARLRRGAKVFYVYTNSGRESRWEGLDVPHIRSFELKLENQRTRIYQPTETFGKVYAQADSWHTDAAGYDLIAQAVFDALKQGKLCCGRRGGRRRLGASEPVSEFDRRPFEHR
jgi:lysophospholipase L1-like esterase